MDIATWLAEQGLEKYSDVFTHAEIDLQTLPHLTDADLKELGLPLGPRRRIVAEAGMMAGARAASPAAMAAVPAPQMEAERRQLTVMFVDLVDSTQLSARLDPEEMREILRDYQNAVTGEIARMGGHVAKLMGDGVLAYFGWPIAREDAAERAVRSGMALTLAVAALGAPAGQKLAARVGIATGLVVVGELVGKAEAQERAVVGDTPNLAARLQAAAPPGSVVIAQGTQRLLGTLFDLDELPPLQFKGFEDAQRAWRVAGDGNAESRFDAMHPTGLVQLVGREQELGLLFDRWRRAKTGEGQIVILSGEPGIGKSRIIVALLEALRAEEFISLRYFCSPLHTGTPFWPVIGQLERAARIVHEDLPAVRLEKLAGLLRLTSSGSQEVTSLFADLLSIPVPGDIATLELTAEEKKARTIRALADQLDVLSRLKPVAVILEDAHWLDPTTRESFDLMVDRIRELPVLCVVTCRPEFHTEWVRQPHVTQLSLNRLSRTEAERIVGELAQGRRLPRDLLDAILAKTEGIPLFVEELTKMVLESGLLRAVGDRFESAAGSLLLTVPDTLRDSLMARLDRLSTVREVAQIGAVLGRDFEFDLLAAVADIDRPALACALDQLVGSELLFRRGIAPSVSYSFKHALIQDTAYQSLLKSRRQQLHSQAAKALQARFADRIATSPELLAHHLTEAGLAEEAVQAWLDAVVHSLKRSAYSEAIGNLRRGLAVAESLPPSLQRNSAEIRLHNALGQVMQTSKGPVAEVEASYRRARELSEAEGDEREWVRASYGLWFCQNWRMEHVAAYRSARELLERVSGSKDSALVLQSHHAVWTTSWQLGRPASAVEHAEIGRSIYDPGQHHAFTAIYGSHDAGVCCCNTLGIARTIMGYVDRGAADAAEGEALARRIGHPFSLSLSLFFRSNIHLLRGEIEITKKLAHEMADLCAQQGIGVYGLVSGILKGWCAAASGVDASGGMKLMRNSLDELARVGARARRTEYLGLFADRALAIGDVSTAKSALAEARLLAEDTGERFFLAELNRLEAATLIAEQADSAAEAEHKLAGAMGVAREQEARLFELRAGADLARLLAHRGERRKALDILVPIHDWFEEGSDTPLIRDVRRLRDELA